MSENLLVTHNYIIQEVRALATQGGFPETVYDDAQLLSEGDPVQPSYLRTMEVSGAYTESPTKRSGLQRQPGEWMWHIVLKFPRMVSFEYLKTRLSSNFQVPVNFEDQGNPTIFLVFTDFVVAHPVEVQASGSGSEGRFTIKAFIRPA
jgi:hypothetical protein